MTEDQRQRRRDQVERAPLSRRRLRADAGGAGRRDPAPPALGISARFARYCPPPTGVAGLQSSSMPLPGISNVAGPMLAVASLQSPPSSV
jgi:hypothetical protein